MSLILDALNKAQRERQENREPVPHLSTIHAAPSLALPPSRRKVRTLGVTLVVLALAVVSGWWFTQSPSRAAQGNAPAEAPVAEAPAQQVAAIAPDTADAAETEAATPAPDTQLTAERVPEPVAEQEPPVQAEVAGLYQTAQRNISDSASEEVALPEPAQVQSEAGVENEPGIRDQSPAEPSPVADKPEITVADNTPAEDPPAAAPAEPTATDSVADRADVAYLQELSSVFQDKLPTIMYAAHNAQPGNRSVVINGSTHRAGAQIAKGLVLEEILSDGVVLRYDNQQFKLRALNSWVNF